jgi:AraC-like DNA-binding protein
MDSSSLLDFAYSALMLGLNALAAALLLSARRTRASLCLAAYFICTAIDSVVGVAISGWRGSLSDEAIRWLHVANVPSAYLLGPLLYGYAVALTSSPSSDRLRRGLWHLVPYGAVLLISLGNAVVAFDQSPAGLQVFRVTFHIWVLQGLLYLVLAVRRTYRARPWLEQANADEVALRLTWLRRLLALFGVIWIFITLDRVTTVMGVLGPPWIGPVENCLSTMAFFILAWIGLRQRTLVPTELAELCSPDEPSRAARYVRSGLDIRQCTQMAAELSRLMIDGQLYTDSGFDLQALSKRSGWPPNYISQALNQGLGQNFFEFVNGFRIGAAERHLGDPAERRTILEIALACGFGSKSTFNAVFKRMTGRTPSEYRRAPPALPSGSTA